MEMGKQRHGFKEKQACVCFRLTLEYCLRRLKRCTILTDWLTDWRTRSWTPLFYSSPLISLQSTHRSHSTNLHTHILKAHTLPSSPNIHVHTHFKSTLLSSTIQTQMRREKEGERGGKKREGEQAQIKTAQLCCPLLIFTVIPWALSLSLTDTVIHIRRSHLHGLQCTNDFQYTHTHTRLAKNLVLHSHRHTPLHILFWTQHW